MHVQPLSKPKTSASKRLLQKERGRQESGVKRLRRKDGRRHLRGGGREQGDKESCSRGPGRSGRSTCWRRQFSRTGRAVACPRTEAPSFGSELQGSSVAVSPARQVRGSAEGSRTFGGGKVWPNPSVKRSAIGRPPSPRSAVVYPALHGLGVLPLSPAYLER